MMLFLRAIDNGGEAFNYSEVININRCEESIYKISYTKVMIEIITVDTSYIILLMQQVYGRIASRKMLNRF